MSSLFARKRNPNPEMLTLPAFCVPADDTANLLLKREAQLEWMRAAGVTTRLRASVVAVVQPLRSGCSTGS